MNSRSQGGLFCLNNFTRNRNNRNLGPRVDPQPQGASKAYTALGTMANRGTALPAQHNIQLRAAARATPLPQTHKHREAATAARSRAHGRHWARAGPWTRCGATARVSHKHTICHSSLFVHTLRFVALPPCL